MASLGDHRRALGSFDWGIADGGCAVCLAKPFDQKALSQALKPLESTGPGFSHAGRQDETLAQWTPFFLRVHRRRRRSVSTGLF